MKLKPLGVQRKELHSYPEVGGEKKDYDKEKVYPEIRLEGKHAELFGAADLKAGGTGKLTAEFEVKSLKKTSEDGKDRYEMVICLKKAQCEDCESSDDEDADEDDGEEEKNSISSPALAYIEKYHSGG
jgi:hypothetical protein